MPGLLAGSPMSNDPLAGQPADSAVPGRRPLDILIVTSEAPPIISGISTCIDRLATGLVARQHRVRVLSCAQIRRIVLGECRLSSFVAYWPQIVRQLRHFDVVNVHGPVPTMSDVFLWLSTGLPSYVRRPSFTPSFADRYPGRLPDIDALQQVPPGPGPAS